MPSTQPLINTRKQTIETESHEARLYIESAIVCLFEALPAGASADALWLLLGDRQSQLTKVGRARFEPSKAPRRYQTSGLFIKRTFQRTEATQMT